MEKYIGFITENKELIGSIVAVIFVLLRKIKKADSALSATAKYAHILADSIEQSKGNDVGGLVVAEVKRRIGTADQAVRAVSDVVVNRVDPKPDKDVPPVKRFWRRLLAGENLVGKVVRGSIVNTIEGQVKKHLK